MSWSPATSQVRRHIARRGFDAQKYWVIHSSPEVASSVSTFPPNGGRKKLGKRESLIYKDFFGSDGSQKYEFFLLSVLKKQEWRRNRVSSGSVPGRGESLVWTLKTLLLYEAWLESAGRRRGQLSGGGSRDIPFLILSRRCRVSPLKKPSRELLVILRHPSFHFKLFQETKCLQLLNAAALRRNGLPRAEPGGKKKQKKQTSHTSASAPATSCLKCS